MASYGLFVGGRDDHEHLSRGARWWRRCWAFLCGSITLGIACVAFSTVVAYFPLGLFAVLGWMGYSTVVVPAYVVAIGAHLAALLAAGTSIAGTVATFVVTSTVFGWLRIAWSYWRVKERSVALLRWLKQFERDERIYYVPFVIGCLLCLAVKFLPYESLFSKVKVSEVKLEKLERRAAYKGADEKKLRKKRDAKRQLKMTFMKVEKEGKETYHRYEPKPWVRWGESICVLVAACTGCVGLVKEVASHWNIVRGIDRAADFIRSRSEADTAEALLREVAAEAAVLGGEGGAPPLLPGDRSGLGASRSGPWAVVKAFLQRNWKVIFCVLGACIAGYAGTLAITKAIEYRRKKEKAMIKEGKSRSYARAQRRAQAQATAQHRSPRLISKKTDESGDLPTDPNEPAKQQFAQARFAKGKSTEFRDNQERASKSERRQQASDAADKMEPHTQNRKKKKEGEEHAFCKAKGADRRDHRKKYWNDKKTECSSCAKSKDKVNKEGTTGRARWPKYDMPVVDGALSGWGGAVVLGTKNLFVTAAHLVCEADESERQFNPEKLVDAAITFGQHTKVISAGDWKVHPTLDLAWCEKPAIPGLKSFKVVPLDEAEAYVMQKEDVARITEDICEGRIISSGGACRVLCDATSRKGDSGGLYFTKDGRVLGVHEGSVGDSTNAFVYLDLPGNGESESLNE